jgi:bis(5'-nucleosyl)-tetraphosphatase (symmetrical)
MSREGYEQLDEKSKRSWGWYLLALACLPVLLYVFIILPMASPEQLHLEPLKKYIYLKHYHGRLILIGDVHGCYDSLQSLLQKLEYSATDTVVLLGDFLSKGPDSLKVMTWARENSAMAILGNHEMNILYKYQSFKPLQFDDEDVFILDKHVNKFDQELQIARKLTPQDVVYLNSLPLVMEIDNIGICSHMGLVDTHSVKKQDITDMLDIDKDWYHSWNKLQKTLPKNDRRVVYYGHHASLGLNLNKYSKGLDSGCVYGGQLSAMVIRQGEESLFQVDC